MFLGRLSEGGLFDIVSSYIDSAGNIVDAFGSTIKKGTTEYDTLYSKYFGPTPTTNRNIPPPTTKSKAISMGVLILILGGLTYFIVKH